MNLIRIPELKEIVLNKTKGLFSEEGFRLNKSQMRFRKETDKAVIDFNFRFFSYPSYSGYQFYCTLILKELNPIIKEYLNFFNADNDIIWNLLIVEGEFIRELLMKERKSQKMYMNVVSTDNINTGINQTLHIIRTEALPKAYTNSTLNGFQEYFLRPERIIGRINEDLFILSCLLAAYLKYPPFYYEVVKFLTSELDKLKEKGKNFVTLYVLIDKLNLFISHKDNEQFNK